MTIAQQIVSEAKGFSSKIDIVDIEKRSVEDIQDYENGVYKYKFKDSSCIRVDDYEVKEIHKL